MQITWDGNGRDDEIEVDAGGWYVTFKQGESKDVPDELANGTPQVGDPNDPESGYACATSGLLARGDFSSGKTKATPVADPKD
jgi:hypothetical protein